MGRPLFLFICIIPQGLNIESAVESEIISSPAKGGWHSGSAPHRGRPVADDHDHDDNGGDDDDDHDDDELSSAWQLSPRFFTMVIVTR